MWGSMRKAIEWAVEVGVYDTYEEARDDYIILRATICPTTADLMFRSWFEQITYLADKKSRRLLDSADNEAMAAVVGYDGPIY